MANSAQHCAILEEELKATIHSNHREILLKVVLHHDNALPHSAVASIEMI
jgi:hypothetical protein